MNPSLAIGPLTNLQDARSSAAVGFDFLVFSLERGDLRMIGSNLVWNIASWISGPEIVIETSRESIEELTTAGDTSMIHALSFQLENWQSWVQAEGLPGDLLPVSRVWIRIPGALPPGEAEEILRQNQAAGLETRFVIPANELPNLSPDLQAHAFLHFPSLQASQGQLAGGHLPVAGYFIGPEAEEAFGLLDYEAIDEWLEQVMGEDWE